MHNKIPTKYYFINSFKKNNIDKLDNNTAIIYRNYKNKLNINEINKIKKYCLKKKRKIFLSNNFKIAIKLGLDGAYIPSFVKSYSHLSFKIKPSFIICIARGGLRVGDILSRIFNIKCGYLGVESYSAEKDNQIANKQSELTFARDLSTTTRDSVSYTHLRAHET